MTDETVNLETSLPNAQKQSPRNQSDLLSCRAAEPPSTETEYAQSLLDRTRTMLAMAIESAFDLRDGRGRCEHLERFDNLLAAQKHALDEIANCEQAVDLKFLAHRAFSALDDFDGTVKRDIVDTVRPGMTPKAFDAALESIEGAAIAAGAAFGSIDIARQHI